MNICVCVYFEYMCNCAYIYTCVLEHIMCIYIYMLHIYIYIYRHEGDDL